MRMAEVLSSAIAARNDTRFIWTGSLVGNAPSLRKRQPAKMQVWGPCPD